MSLYITLNWTAFKVSDDFELILGMMGVAAGSFVYLLIKGYRQHKWLSHKFRTEDLEDRLASFPVSYLTTEQAAALNELLLEVSTEWKNNWQKMDRRLEWARKHAKNRGH